MNVFIEKIQTLITTNLDLITEPIHATIQALFPKILNEKENDNGHGQGPLAPPAATVNSFAKMLKSFKGTNIMPFSGDVGVTKSYKCIQHGVKMSRNWKVCLILSTERFYDKCILRPPFREGSAQRLPWDNRVYRDWMWLALELTFRSNLYLYLSGNNRKEVYEPRLGTQINSSIHDLIK